MVLEPVRRRTLQLHVIQSFQDEGGFFVIDREQGIKHLLSLVEVAQRLGPRSGREECTHTSE